MNPEMFEAVASAFGTIYQVVAVSKFSQTYLVASQRGKLIVKSMSEYPQQDYEQVFELLRLHQVPHAPLLKCITLSSKQWLAVSQFMPGYKATVDGNAAYPLLKKLRAIPAPLLDRHLEKRWLKRLSDVDNPVIQHGLKALGQPPSSADKLILAHGDFAPQNVLTCQGDTILIDWEESGCADEGFDPGWMLALNRIGAGFQNMITPEIENLNWFIGLGLLRLYYRLLHMTQADFPKAAILHKIETQFLALGLASGL